MNKILFIVALSLCAGLAFAQNTPAKKKLDLKPQVSQKELDPGSATHLLYEDPKKLQLEEESNKAKVKVTATCTDQLGMIHNSGDKGYDACLRTLDKTSSSKQDKQNSSAGFTIGK